MPIVKMDDYINKAQQYVPITQVAKNSLTKANLLKPMYETGIENLFSELFTIFKVLSLVFDPPQKSFT